MPDPDALADRVRAVERALTDADSLPDLAAADADRVTDLEARVDRVEDRLDALDADVQAIRGYVGQVDAAETPPVRESVPRPETRHPVPEFDPVESTESESPSLRERVFGFL